MERPLLFRRPIGRPKGRPADPSAAASVAVLLDGLPRTPDLLIEALHRVQDAEGHLTAAMIAAIAGDFRMSQAEVFEVATFYHHFDVGREGEAVPPALTVRV